MMRRFLCACLFLVTAASGATLSPGAPCVTDNLANYIALGVAGCSVPTLPTAYQFHSFDFDKTVGSPLNAVNFTIVPGVIASDAVLDISAAFLASGAAQHIYYVGYVQDPPPLIIHGYESELFATSPVAPGIATVTAEVCHGSGWVGPIATATCPTTIYTATVFHNGNPLTSVFRDQVYFPAANTIGVRLTFDIDANGASSQIDGVGTRGGSLPEPGTLGLVGAALLGLWRLRRRL